MEKEQMNKSTPPQWVLRFLRWFCDEIFHEEIEGDLYELYHEYAELHSYQLANRRFFLYLFPYLKPYFWRKRSFSFLQSILTIAMINNYLKVAFRNFLRNRSFSLTSLLGLTIGTVALLFISEYVLFEKSYDQFHENGDNLYRLRAEGWHNDGRVWFRSTANFPVAGPQVTEKVPEVLDFTRLIDTEAIIHPQGLEEGKSYKESEIYFADSSLLSMFSFPLLKGDSQTALKEPNSVVLTEEMAKKYFNHTDIIGKILVYNQEGLLTITGVLKDIPANSHLDFDFLISYTSLDEPVFYESWGWNNFTTYVALTPDANIEQLHEEFDQILYDQKGDYFESVEAREIWRLQALDQIRLYSGFNNEAGIDAQANLVQLLFLIGIFVMVLAWINFINMSTARAIERGKEVGVRKAIGATKKQLISQFLVESFLLNGIAVMLAIVLIRLLAPSLSQYTGYLMNVPIWEHVSLWKNALIIWIIGSLLSGLYPAIVMGSFRPVSVLKGKRIPGSAFSMLRKGLVILQFAMAIGLVIGTLSIYLQIQYMRSQHLGFNIDQIFTLHGPQAFEVDSTFDEYLATFENTLLRNANIQQFTSSQTVPSYGLSNWGGYIRRGDFDASHANTYSLVRIDDSFFDTYEIELIAGRNFSEEILSDQNAIIITETARKRLEFDTPESAINQLVLYPINGRQDGTKARVIGVAKDHHHYSLRNVYQPIIYQLSPASPEYFSLRLNTENLGELVKFIEKTWHEYFGTEPFDAFFLDQRFDQLYQEDLAFGKICGIFAGLAVFIALLGLFGLSTYMTIQREKEISIRKILGAQMIDVVSLLSSQFVIIVSVSGLVAIPFSYWAVYTWLEGFPFHMRIHPLIFFIPIIGTVVIACLAVSWQTFKSATANPVESLRYE